MKNIEFRLILDSDFKIAVFGARFARVASVFVFLLLLPETLAMEDGLVRLQKS